MTTSSKTHQRSISLPSRLNQCPTRIETELSKLKTLELEFSSSSSIESGLVCLAELYLCVNELIRSSQTQKAHIQQSKPVEDALEESIVLLDSCNSLKDLLTSTKENVQNIQSALRRKGGDSSIEGHVSAYFCFRKKAKKMIAKNIGLLKQMECKTSSSLGLDVDHHMSMMIRVVREVVAITISIFRSLLLFLSMKTKPRFSLISKVMSKSRSTFDGNEDVITEVEIVDLALQSLQKNIRNTDTKSVDVRAAMERLQNLDARIKGFEAGLDCLFRRLIECRVSLLNMLAN